MDGSSDGLYGLISGAIVDAEGENDVYIERYLRNCRLIRKLKGKLEFLSMRREERKRRRERVLYLRMELERVRFLEQVRASSLGGF